MKNEEDRYDYEIDDACFNDDDTEAQAIGCLIVIGAAAVSFIIIGFLVLKYVVFN